MSDDKDGTPATAIANDVVSIRATGTWQDFHDIAAWHVARTRRAALEEAAAEMDHREQVATTARDSYLKINSPEDAARHEHYRVAYGSGAGAIRELKDK